MPRNHAAAHVLFSPRSLVAHETRGNDFCSAMTPPRSQKVAQPGTRFGKARKRLYGSCVGKAYTLRPNIG